MCTHTHTGTASLPEEQRPKAAVSQANLSLAPSPPSPRGEGGGTRVSWAPPNWTALRSPPWATRASPTPVGAVALLWGTPTPSSPLTPQVGMLCEASLLGCYGNILYPSSPLVGNSAPIVIQSSLPVAPGQVCHVTCHMMCHMTVARCFVFGA